MMKSRNNFYFNFDAFDFWPIYDTIKKYYPIGIPFNDTDYEFYRSYSGVEDMSNLVLDNIHNDKNFQDRWKKFEKQLKTKLNKEVIGTTYAHAPSFSGYITLEHKKQDGVSYSKELHFAFSLLGPYYTIYGLDTTDVILNMDAPYRTNKLENGIYRAINAITTSPIKEYEEHFLKLEKLIEEKYTNYKLVPFRINMMSIKGLQVNHSDREDCIIFSALFHDYHDFNEKMSHRGDGYYGSDNWRK